MHSRALRIAIIAESFPSETETFICRHIKAFRADVLAVRLDEQDLKSWEWRPYVAVCLRQKSSQESRARHILRRLKEVTFGIPAPRWPKGMQSVWDRYVDDRRPDVALAEFGPNGMCAMQACHKQGIPLIVHFHGYDASSLLRFSSYLKALPRLFELSAAVVVVSRKMRSTLEWLGCPSDKLHVIPCGAPVREFALSNAVANQPCRFLAVSSFAPVKGTMYTLRAFAHCARQCPETTLTMIGDGKEYQKAKAWVEGSGLSHRIRLLGSRPNEAVREHMAASSVFVQHSVKVSIGRLNRTHVVEGWGISLAEAASSGLPVIATHHGGIPDQVVDGQTGFLVEERDWSAAGDKMVILARNPELRHEMGLAGRHNIELVGNSEIQIEKLREVLKGAVTRGPMD